MHPRAAKLRKLRHEPKQPPKTFPKAGKTARKFPAKLRRQVPRAMHDKRELELASMFAPENQQAPGQFVQGRRGMLSPQINFTPPPFDLSRIWEDPDKPGTVKPDKFLVFFGKRRTGKSFTLRSILADGRHQFPYGVVFTKTRINGDWQKHFPNNYVHDFDIVALRTFIELQKAFVAKWNKNEWMQANINPYKIMVLDDVVAQNFRYNEEVTEAATAGRHFKICVALTTQYPKLIATAVRSNTDYAFIFFQKTFNEKEAIAKEYLNTVDVQSAMEFIERNTNVEGVQRDVLVADNVQLNSDIQKTTYLYQPQDPGKFVVGCKDFWKHDQRWRELCGGVEPHDSALTLAY